MSRIGKNPIQLPEKVEISVAETSSGSLVKIKGPKGELEFTLRKEIKIKVEGRTVILKRESEEKLIKSLHGTSRTMIQNMVSGVLEGFKKELDIVGIGYKAQMQGPKLILQVGYSHPVEIEPPSKETKIEIDKNQTHITITGINKQIVGDLAASIRAVRAPEPYKGKGIKYSNEKIRKKAGKSAAKK